VFIFLIHQVCTRIGLAVYMLCMSLILSTGSFLFRGLIAYMVGDVTRGAGPSSLPSARNPLFMDFATLRAHITVLMFVLTSGDTSVEQMSCI